MTEPRYVLITAAKNEADYLPLTIESVAAQAVRPVRWIIVDDGSADRTPEIVREAEARHGFISLLQARGEDGRNFASKARAVGAAYESLRGLAFDYVGILDGDISFDPQYYAGILREFAARPAMGIASGVFLELTAGEWKMAQMSLHHPTGAVQMFRRACFEGVGGYLPLRTGGVDSVAAIMARMKGWETRSFAELPVKHHRREGTGGSKSIFRVRLRQGATDYNLGTHPCFMLVRAASRAFERPILIGSALRLAGYFGPWLKGQAREVPEDFVRYVQAEQMGRVRGLFSARKPEEKGQAPARP